MIVWALGGNRLPPVWTACSQGRIIKPVVIHQTVGPKGESRTSNVTPRRGVVYVSALIAYKTATAGTTEDQKVKAVTIIMIIKGICKDDGVQRGMIKWLTPKGVRAIHATRICLITILKVPVPVKERRFIDNA